MCTQSLPHPSRSTPADLKSGPCSPLRGTRGGILRHVVSPRFDVVSWDGPRKTSPPSGHEAPSYPCPCPERKALPLTPYLVSKDALFEYQDWARGSANPVMGFSCERDSRAAESYLGLGEVEEKVSGGVNKALAELFSLRALAGRAILLVRANRAHAPDARGACAALSLSGCLSWKPAGQGRHGCLTCGVKLIAKSLRSGSAGSTSPGPS